MASAQVDNPSGARPWLVRLATTLAAWLAAFLMVMALFALVGDELESRPLAVRALAVSGVLVILMLNLVMPILGPAVARWFAPANEPSTTSATPNQARRSSPLTTTARIPEKMWRSICLPRSVSVFAHSRCPFARSDMF